MKKIVFILFLCIALMPYEASADMRPIKQQVTGEVVAVDVKVNTLTVKGKKSDVTVSIDDSTTLFAGKDKKTLADVKFGFKVTVNYTKYKGNNVATKIAIKGAYAKKEGIPDNGITVVKAPPELNISSLSLSEPSGNGILDAEETGKILIEVKNNGRGDAIGTALVLEIENEANSQGIQFDRKTVIGRIKPGEQQNIQVSIKGGEDIKSGDIRMKAVIVESNGFDTMPTLLSFQTRKLYPPLLQIAKVEITDADGKRQISKGKETTVALIVQNAGSGAASNVTAVIESGNQYVKLFGESSISIGTLAPGETKKAEFTIVVTQRYSGTNALPISFNIREGRDRFSIKPDIKLALNEEAPDIKVVRVQSKETPVVKVTESEGIENVPSLLASQKIITENDIAVVIGIEKYQNIPKSDYSYNDAKLMKAYMRAMGFAERNIEYLIDDRATLSAIRTSIETKLPNRVKKGQSRVFVYYSGHGAPDPSTGEAYIMPYESDPNYLSDMGYPLKKLYASLGKLEAKEVMVVMDSCFSGAGGRSVLAKGARPAMITVKDTVLPSSVAVLSSAQGTQISTSLPDKEHGVFTYYFLKALKEGKKDMSEIYDYIKPLVEDEAKRINVTQSPSISSDVDGLRGKFVLRK